MIDTAAAAAGAGGPGGQAGPARLRGRHQPVHRARRARDPTKLPAEYTGARRSCPRDWKPTDTAAVASLIGGIFGRGRRGETAAGDGAARGASALRPTSAASRVFSDFRSLNDPEAPVTTPRRFEFPDRAARVKRKVRRRGRTAARAGRAATRAWRCPTAARCATATRWRRSVRGEPRSGPGVPPGCGPARRRARLRRPPGLERDARARAPTPRRGARSAVTGPQVAYYSPEILLELDLHGGGVDSRGVAFPGISLYVLIGRGKDYSWSATTATTDNVDEFVEELCEPSGPRAHARSRTHYRYKGRCVADERPAARAAHARAVGGRHRGGGARHPAELLRTVHGPVTKTATMRGQAGGDRLGPLDLHARARLGARLQAAEPQRGHRRALLPAHDVHDQLPLQLVLQRRARHRLPPVGLVPAARARHRPVAAHPRHGPHDWRRFNAGTFDSARASFGQLPKDINPPRGYIVSWNNKQAPGLARGRRPARVQLGAPLRAARGPRARGHQGHAQDRPARGSSRSWATPARSTSAGRRCYPWLRRVIGRPRDGGRAPADSASSTAGWRAARTAWTATATTPTRTPARSR